MSTRRPNGKLLSLDGTLARNGDVITAYPVNPAWKVGDFVTVIDRAGKGLGVARCDGTGLDFWMNGQTRTAMFFTVMERW